MIYEEKPASDCRQTRLLLSGGAAGFHSRRFAFRGAGGEPPQASLCGVSPVPLIPQESRAPSIPTGSRL
ncbi:hypothetical protein [Bacillus thermotolerans]|uniref:hypothetical protein n=1 Tax=Bacillus thermotolerans TaxID=1221996 RepID=UPI000580A1B1|nr:hypothetical protein [Bacillus thermotolerans]